MNYKGVIIEESLENTEVLKEVNIIATKVEQVTDSYLSKWTLHTVEIPEEKSFEVANKLSESLDQNHAWYADFKNKNWHYIIFPEKVFKVNRSNPDEYNKATKYGISLGIPDYQLDFSPDIK